MNRRNLYFAVFIVAALLAGGAYLYAQPRIDVVTAASDISPNVKITDAMLSSRKVAPGDVPSGHPRRSSGSIASGRAPKRSGVRRA